VIASNPRVTAQTGTIILLLVLLCGCAQWREGREQRLNARLNERCVKLGFMPETPEFLQCRLEVWKSFEASKAAAAARPIEDPIFTPQGIPR
jgi:hypothetical protein